MNENLKVEQVDSDVEEDEDLDESEEELESQMLDGEFEDDLDLMRQERFGKIKPKKVRGRLRIFGIFIAILMIPLQVFLKSSL